MASIGLRTIFVLHFHLFKIINSVKQLSSYCFMFPTVNLNKICYLSFLFEENLDGEIDPKRYSDNEELRFSLRSIER